MLDEVGCTNFGCLQFDNVISFLCIAPFIRIKLPSLSHLIIISLMSTLLDVSIATLASFGGLGKSPSFSPWASVYFCL
jgi:hypothetical protein